MTESCVDDADAKPPKEPSAPAAPVTAEPQRVAHHAECSSAHRYGIGLNAGEPEAWAASRLTPPHYPFTVTAIDYEWLLGAGCEAALTHTRAVWKGTGTAPAEPVDLQVWSEPVTMFSSGTVPSSVSRPYGFKRPLQTPIVLQEGEHLFLATRIIRGVRGSSCAAICRGTPGDATRNYWGEGGAELPTEWASLASFGITEDFRYAMIGH